MELGISAARLVTQIAVLALSMAGDVRLVPRWDVDLALVLAVDVSSSMNMDEMRAQRDGYVAAFRHPAVLQSIPSGAHGRIAVSYLEWAGRDHQQIVIPWTIIDDEAAAESFASELAGKPLVTDTGTSIAGGLIAAGQLLKPGKIAAARRVIDVSGDGPNNSGLPVAPVRDRLVRLGITINGLPITLSHRDSGDAAESYGPGYLETYYEDCVIGGPESFLVPVAGMGRLREAILMKLVQEIAGATLPDAPRAHRAVYRAKVECLGAWQVPGR
jgi:hypothetical protein